jgi:ABC-type nickel/cobalt efflux system permease component RcnA
MVTPPPPSPPPPLPFNFAAVALQHHDEYSVTPKPFLLSTTAVTFEHLTGISAFVGCLSFSVGYGGPSCARFAHTFTLYTYTLHTHTHTHTHTDTHTHTHTHTHTYTQNKDDVKSIHWLMLLCLILKVLLNTKRKP